MKDIIIRYGAVHICLMSIQVFVGVAQIILILWDSHRVKKKSCYIFSGF